MVLRHLLTLLILVGCSPTLPAQSTPQFQFIRYTGTGTNERTIAAAIDSISLVIATATLPQTAATKTHPDFLYIRVDSCDNYTGTHSTGADADSICFFGPIDNDAFQTLTPKGIKRWSGSNIVIGRHLNRLDTSYVMWVIADPDTVFLGRGFWEGDASTPRDITHGFADTMQAAFFLSSEHFASLAGYALYTKIGGTEYKQYFGERGLSTDIAIEGPTFQINESRWNLATEVYGWFGIKKGADSTYWRMLTHVGDGAASADDTMLYVGPSGFRSFFTIGGAVALGSVTTGVFGTSEMTPDTSFHGGSTDGTNLVTGASSATRKSVPDSFIVYGGNSLDVNTLTHQILFIGDTTSFTSASTPATDTRRDPCSGNISIDNKGNIEISEKYR